MKYVEPHKVISKKVEATDFQRVLDSIKDMVALCNKPVGRYRKAYGVAHCQVEAKMPLRFFVYAEGIVVINPRIIRHTKTTVPHQEGCATFPNRETVTVQRYNKCEVEYRTVVNGSPSNLIRENLGGHVAKAMQHLIDLMDGKTIYDQSA